MEWWQHLLMSAVAMTSNYVSSADLIASETQQRPLHKRDVDEQLIKRYGDQGITGLMELLGSKKETTAQTFEHYEKLFFIITLQQLYLGSGVLLY